MIGENNLERGRGRRRMTKEAARIDLPSRTNELIGLNILPGNKEDVIPLSSGRDGADDAPVSGVDSMSHSFSDQLIAVMPRLRRFARGLTGSASDADDLVQSACERALSRSHQFQEGTRFDSWMFRIVQTIWIDQLRASNIRRTECEDEAVHIGTDAPVRLVEARLELNEVRGALMTIPPDQRAALLLVTVEGLSYKEAAEIAKVPVGTIMSRLARARVALQARLSTDEASRRSLSNAAAQ